MTDRKQNPDPTHAAPGKPSRAESNVTLVLWALISFGLWLLTPDRFTQTDGPAGVFTLVVVGLVGLFTAMLLQGVFRRFFKSR